MASSQISVYIPEGSGSDELDVDAAVDEYVPDGFETAQAFLDYATKLYEDDILYDSDNRMWALEDLEFLAGNQWDPEIQQEREDSRRPCLTINVLPQFVGQVIGDRRVNKVAIKVRALKSGTQLIADARSGLIKSIEQYSRADRVYDATCEDQVACGLGAMRVDLEYAGNDVFDQDIIIRHIPNPLAVVWDRMSVDPTGRDARHCFVADTIPKDVFEKQFPKVGTPTGFADDATTNSNGWWDSNTYRLVEFWELVDKPATFAMMQGGEVEDVTGLDEVEYQERLFVNPKTGKPLIRKSFRTYARMHLVTGFAILTQAYEIPLTRLPIIKVEGRVVRVGNDRVRFGLIRFAKDSQRLKNYWRSVAAETIALAPKSQWAGPEDAWEGRAEAWSRAQLTGEPLMWSKNASAEPKRLDPPKIPEALLQEAALNQQDIKDTTGIQDASLGVRSNEVSGRAIDARAAQGDVATVVYHDNMNASIQEVGDVVNQLIPIVYDSIRTIRVIGDDEKHKLITINDPNDDDSPNIVEGKYDVTIQTGPSFATQRIEALDAMFKLIQTSPDLMGVIGDLVAKNMDWPGAHEIAERMQKLPTIKQFLEPEDDGSGANADPNGLEAQQQQIAQSMQQAQLEDAAGQLESQAQLRDIEVRTAEANAKAAEAKAAQAAADAEVAQNLVDKTKADAEAAQSRADRERVLARAAPHEVDQKYRHAEDTTAAKVKAVKSRNQQRNFRKPKKVKDTDNDQA